MIFVVYQRIYSMYLTMYFRSTMDDDRLSALAMLSIENDVARQLKYDDIINQFAENKSRRKAF